MLALVGEGARNAFLRFIEALLLWNQRISIFLLKYAVYSFVRTSA